jgi:hypothetical protein
LELLVLLPRELELVLGWQLVAELVLELEPELE